MFRKAVNFAGAISLDNDLDNEISLVDKILYEKNYANYNRFKEGNLRKEVSKIITVKSTQYQFEVVHSLAKLKGKTIKSLFLDYIAEEAKKEGLFNQIKD